MADVDQIVKALEGSLSKEEYAALLSKLDFLKMVKTQEEYDEGARLHALKNSPWASGPYSHLPHEVLHPPYVFREFPMAVYDCEYEAAVLELDQARQIPAWGTDDAQRAMAIKLAETKMGKHCRKIHTTAELEAGKGVWFRTPREAVEAKQAQQKEIGVLAAHRAYEDRNMSPLAQAEIDAFDEAADEHVTVIPEKKRPGRRKKVHVPVTEA